MVSIPYQTRIALRIKELEVQLDQMMGEMNELRIAQKVLIQLGDTPELSEVLARPAAPTIGDRILSILNEKGPQLVPQIYEYLAQDGMGEVPYNSLSGTLSRLQRKGLVQNLSGKWEAVVEGNENQTARDDRPSLPAPPPWPIPPEVKATPQPTWPPAPPLPVQISDPPFPPKKELW
jgi:hypothetical protein